MITIFCLVYWTFVITFIFCESGEQVTSEFDEFHDRLCQLNWYEYPYDLQRMFIIILINAQRPETIQGFGNTVCSRELFKMVSVYLGKDPYLSWSISLLFKCIIQKPFSINRQSRANFPILWHCDKSMDNFVLKIENLAEKESKQNI